MPISEFGPDQLLAPCAIIVPNSVMLDLTGEWRLWSVAGRTSRRDTVVVLGTAQLPSIAVFCCAVRDDRSPLSLESKARGRSPEVSSTALPHAAPNLQAVPLIANSSDTVSEAVLFRSDAANPVLVYRLVRCSRFF